MRDFHFTVYKMKIVENFWGLIASFFSKYI